MLGVGSGDNVTLPLRKKITITLPKYKPEPEKPPRICRVCETEQPGWQFGSGAHPDICNVCIHDSSSIRPPEFRNIWLVNDAAVIASASAVIRSLRHGG